MSKAKDMLKKVADKTETKQPVKFKSVRWFDTVRNDTDKFEKAVAYFHEAVEDGTPYLAAVGNLQTMLAELPGLAGFYRPILVDAQQLRRWLETSLEQEKAKKYKWFMSDPEAKKEYGALKTTEATNFMKAEEDLHVIADMVREIANCEHQLEVIAEGLNQKGMTLSKIVDLRVAGLEEVWINSAEETKNE